MRYTLKSSWTCRALLYASLVLVPLALFSRTLSAETAEPIAEPILPARDIIAGEQVELKGKNFPAPPSEITVVISKRYLASSTVKGDSRPSKSRPKQSAANTNLPCELEQLRPSFKSPSPRSRSFLPRSRLRPIRACRMPCRWTAWRSRARTYRRSLGILKLFWTGTTG